MKILSQTCLLPAGLHAKGTEGMALCSALVVLWQHSFLLGGSLNLSHLYNSIYWYQWHNKKLLNSKQHQIVHVWISLKTMRKIVLAFSVCFLEELCSCFSSRLQWRSHQLNPAWEFPQQSTALSLFCFLWLLQCNDLLHQTNLEFIFFPLISAPTAQDSHLLWLLKPSALPLYLALFLTTLSN